MKKITAHFNTGAGLVAQTFEVYDRFDPVHGFDGLDLKHVELDVYGRGRALVNLDHVAFWTYD